MIKVTTAKQLLNKIKNINILRIKKPKIIGILINPNTWATLIKQDIYVVKNFGVVCKSNVPENLIITLFQNSEEEMEFKKIKNIKQLEDCLHDFDEPEITIHPDTYEKLKIKKGVALTHLRIHTDKQWHDRQVQIVPGLIEIGYPILSRYEGTQCLTDTLNESDYHFTVKNFEEFKAKVHGGGK